MTCPESLLHVIELVLLDHLNYYTAVHISIHSYTPVTLYTCPTTPSPRANNNMNFAPYQSSPPESTRGVRSCQVELRIIR